MTKLRMTHNVSTVGVGSTDTGMLGRKLGRSRARHDVPSTVTWNGWSYLIGAGVERYARPIERMDVLRLADGAELRALTYKTWYDLFAGVPSAQRHATMMVGLPVEVMADTALARETRKQLRAWAEGEHTFSVDGDPLTLTIARVEVLAQPAGTFYAWGFDDAGRWVRARDDQRALVAVCDIGFNTLDLFTVQGGQIQGRFTGGDNLGMRRAAEVVIQAVQREYGVTLSKHAADALVRERRPELMTAGQRVDLSGIVEQARTTNAGAILSFLEERWDNGRQFGYVLFTGGGAEALRDTLLDHYPHGIVMPEPVTANALGLARAAYRLLQRYAAPYVIGLDPGYGGFKAVALRNGAH